MIKYCMRSDSILLLGQSQRFFSHCGVLREKSASSYHFTPHSRGYLRTSLSDEKTPAPSQYFFKLGQKDPGQHTNRAGQLSQQELQGKDNGLKSKWSSYSMPPKDALKKQEQEQKKSEERTSVTTEEASKETGTGAENPARLRRRKNKRVLRPRKALISLSPRALTHLRSLLDQPEPKMIRIGVKNRGCSGLTYDLHYVNEPAKYDEVVEQDGIKVIVDSKALFSVVGSEMDWIDDRLSSRFVFRNPNSKGTCGCGESFMV